MSERKAEFDHTPQPVLTYHFWSRDWKPDPTGVIGEPGSPRLYSIREAMAWEFDGALRIALRGPMRKRDGGEGQHERSLFVDLDREQPGWVANLIADVRRRLSVPPGTRSGGDR